MFDFSVLFHKVCWMDLKGLVMQKRQMLHVIGAIAFCLLFLVDFASAYQAWGVVGASSDRIFLHPIDTATGIISSDKVSISGTSLSKAPVDDLASDPSRYPTFVWAVRNPLTGNELIAVDPFQEQVVSHAIIDAAETIVAIAINPLTGIMYGTSEESLYTIDAFSGSSTLIGPTASPVTGGLGFDESGQLYGVQVFENRVASVVEVDKADALLTTIASLVANSSVDIATNPQDGILYGLGPNIYDLVAIDPVDGDVTSIGDSLIRPSGLAFTTVPEPLSIVMIAIAVVVLLGSRSGWHRQSAGFDVAIR